MNVWKPIALCSIAGLALSVGIQTAHAQAGACKNQKNMADAVASLFAARDSLNKAEHNKGGWRDRAIGAVNTAINETRAGCDVANEH